MIEVRLRGLLKDLDAMVDTLKQNYDVISVSKPYRDKDSSLYRVYIKIEAIEVLG
ncbi:DUF3970 family protein [Bacillaceae bacterium C204]|uniref:DUF3970 family protein n=1 Tax=Neobacillus sp. 204 TaxID=3383351 RepID=UPI003978385B